MTNSPCLWFKGSPDIVDECVQCGKSVRDHYGAAQPTRTVTREELLKEYPMATNTPSKEEVAAREWLRSQCVSDVDSWVKPLAELLASYAAEQGRFYEQALNETLEERDHWEEVITELAVDAGCELESELSPSQSSTVSAPLESKQTSRIRPSH